MLSENGLIDISIRLMLKFKLVYTCSSNPFSLGRTRCYVSAYAFVYTYANVNVASENQAEATS